MNGIPATATPIRMCNLQAPALCGAGAILNKRKEETKAMKKESVYMVWDLNNDELVSVHRHADSAREAVIRFLIEKTGYSRDDWEVMASDAGYDSIEDFQEAIRKWDDYDEDMQMLVRRVEIED